MAPADRLESVGNHLSPPKKIILTRLLWISYKHKNIPAALKFYNDFGLALVAHTPSPSSAPSPQPKDAFFLRGYGPEAFCLRAVPATHDAFDGAAFEVSSAADLAHAAATLPGASPVYTLDAPGGGRCVSFCDPVDGFPFHLVHGQERVTAQTPEFAALRFNFPQDKTRATGAKQRFQKRPAPVHKLGHFGVCTTDFERTYEFYTRTFNFIPSELIHNAEGRNIHTFIRLDRGDEPVDHHCFFFFQGPQFHVHHSSFETHDFDTQVLGHDWLRQQGYRNCWGVGRHVMGSQIFDYWFDPSGFIMEHYVDGDMLDRSEPTHHTLAAADNMHIWGPDVPPSFLA